MTFIDKLRGIMGSGKVQPRSDRDKKIAEISARVHDDDYELQDYLPDTAAAELAEDRAEYGDDLEYPVGPTPTMEEVLDREWVEKRVQAGKKLAEAEEQARVKKLQELNPDATLDFSGEYAEVWGVPGIVWTQDQKYFDRAGKEVKDPKI